MPGPAKGWMTIDDVDMNTVLYDYIMPRDELYNTEAQIDLRAAFCTDHTEAYFEFPVNKFIVEELGPSARPQSSIRLYGKKQRDIRKFGVGDSYTIDWLVRERQPLRTILDHQEAAHEADRELVRAIILSALLDGTTHYGLFNTAFGANEKLTKPISYGQNTFASTHTHYTTSGTASLSTLTPITAAKQHMREHGRNGPYSVYCNSETLKDVENMAAWNIRSSGNQPTPNPITDSVALNGYQGRMLGMNWIVNEAIPADYLIVVDTSIGSKLMKFVQTAVERFRGLLHFSNDHGQLLVGETQYREGVYPLVNSFYLRWFNSFVALRDAAVVIQVTEGSYVTPDVTGAFIGTAND
jgi:hypothetical protein